MTSQQICDRALAGALAGVLALCGCGSDEHAAASATPTSAPAQTATATPTPAAALPASLRGSWKRTMTARDWHSSGYPVGTFRFAAAKDGAVNVYFPGKSAVDFTPQFMAKGHQLTIDSIPVCPGQTATYKWHASGSTLKLTVTDDGGCKPAAALFGGTWTRRG